MKGNRSLYRTLVVLWMAAAAWSPALASERGPQGTWVGALEFSGMKLRIVFKITGPAEGPWKSAMDSPDQGAKDIPLDETLVRGDSLLLRASAIAGEYAGISRDGWNSVQGRWKQGGLELPLDLALADSVPGNRRPQEPVPPFPYRSEDVSVPNPAAGVTLAGVFTRPEGHGPFPAAVLVSGSGPQDRDEFVFGHKPFLVLADALTRRGIAVLRFDDRGVGRSTGDFGAATTEDFISDAAAALAYLRTRPEVDGNRAGIVGHSEGALVAPRVASGPQAAAFAVLLAGPGMRGDALILLQGETLARAAGADTAAIAENTAVQKRVFAALFGTRDADSASVRVRAVLSESIAALSEEERRASGLNEAAVEMQVAQAVSPWFRNFLAYDPAPALEKTRCPVLALWGEKDLQVPPAENMPLVRAALARGGNARVTVRIFPGLNHLFQACSTGAVAEYGSIEETFSPEALRLIGDWILDLR